MAPASSIRFKHFTIRKISLGGGGMLSRPPPPLPSPICTWEGSCQGNSSSSSSSAGLHSGLPVGRSRSPPAVSPPLSLLRPCKGLSPPKVPAGRSAFQQWTANPGREGQSDRQRSESKFLESRLGRRGLVATAASFRSSPGKGGEGVSSGN